MKYAIPCPWCNQSVITTAEWLQNNDRVCCMSCNKAFEVKIKSEDKDEDYDNVRNNGDYWD